ncbi:MAG TPA: N-6 DNA methylase [Thermoanaerobaculia bacterium]|nr:N-6 DNA methylase [Thermoanaerobaculia bacterium]
MLDTAEIRKSRGAFFTPADLSAYVAQWAVRSPADSVLEPSCGEAAFLLSVGARLRSLGARDLPPYQLQGIEIHPSSLAEARQALAQAGLKATLHRGDFFDFSLPAKFDVVVGNPPYVRYQSFTGETRRKAHQVALAEGVRLPGLASSWAAFVVHAASCLNANGRLGLVLPAELMTVNYAAPVRRFLLERFAQVTLVLFSARVFPGVLEEVVLLLAEGRGPTDHCTFLEVQDLACLDAGLTGNLWSPSAPGQKWTYGLLPRGAAEIYGQQLRQAAFADLLTWGQTDLGMVTGNNRYFTLSAGDADRLGLPEEDLLPISPPSSRHLRGLCFTREAWRAMAAEGARVFLFDPAARLSRAAHRYIAEGERLGVHGAYKCRVRTPWWRVPKVKVPDLFFTYMNHDTPRLVANQAGVHYLNSIHGVSLRPEARELGRELLPLAMLNSLTLLGAELVGRSYGGGLLKLEPKEADQLPLPTLETLRQVAPQLRALLPQVGTHLRHADLLQVVGEVDRLLLRRHLGLRRADLLELQAARQVLFQRRMARAGKKL